MAMLVCSAQKCVYNDGMYCSKGDIKVGGESRPECRRPAVRILPNEPRRERKVPWAVLRRKSMLHVKPVTVYTMMNTNVRQIRSVL